MPASPHAPTSPMMVAQPEQSQPGWRWMKAPCPAVFSPEALHQMCMPPAYPAAVRAELHSTTALAAPRWAGTCSWCRALGKRKQGGEPISALALLSSALVVPPGERRGAVVGSLHLLPHHTQIWGSSAPYTSLLRGVYTTARSPPSPTPFG